MLYLRLLLPNLLIMVTPLNGADASSILATHQSDLRRIGITQNSVSGRAIGGRRKSHKKTSPICLIGMVLLVKQEAESSDLELLLPSPPVRKAVDRCQKDMMQSVHTHDDCRCLLCNMRIGETCGHVNLVSRSCLVSKRGNMQERHFCMCCSTNRALSAVANIWASCFTACDDWTGERYEAAWLCCISRLYRAM